MHITQRKDNFITIEEPFDLNNIIKENQTYLIDCMSMLIFNNLDRDIDYLLNMISKILAVDANIVFVLNDVNSGVVPIDTISRKFVDFTGIVGQKKATNCNEVYEVKFGIAKQIK